MTAAADRIADAYRFACLTELRALKPGNVHVHAAGHGMSIADFEASCAASAPAIGRPGVDPGRRILDAVRATREAVGCNTNLGIVLLAAPLAQAALRNEVRPIRERLREVLDSLTVEDAVDAYAAIRLAAPGGLGSSPRHDVRDVPAVTLRQAMAEAADRDAVARQFVTAYADIFDRGLPEFRRALERWHDPEWAAAAVYMDFLAWMRDSHVARKFGEDAAENLRRRAAPYCEALRAAAAPAKLTGRLLRFDAELKREGLNPGTSADLCVATIFVAALDQGCRNKITDLL